MLAALHLLLPLLLPPPCSAERRAQSCRPPCPRLLQASCSRTPIPPAPPPRLGHACRRGMRPGLLRGWGQEEQDRAFDTMFWNITDQLVSLQCRESSSRACALAALQRAAATHAVPRTHSPAAHPPTLAVCSTGAAPLMAGPTPLCSGTTCRPASTTVLQAPPPEPAGRRRSCRCHLSVMIRGSAKMRSR